MPVTQKFDKRDAVAEACSIAERLGEFGTDDYKVALSPGSPEIKVYDRRTGKLVAYSSTKADYVQSLEEFVHDYVVAPLMEG